MMFTLPVTSQLMLFGKSRMPPIGLAVRVLESLNTCKCPGVRPIGSGEIV